MMCLLQISLHSAVALMTKKDLDVDADEGEITSSYYRFKKKVTMNRSNDIIHCVLICKFYMVVLNIIHRMYLLNFSLFR